MRALTTSWAVARIALRSPIQFPPADAVRGVGSFLYEDARG